MGYLSGKNFKDENFPVASTLIKKGVRDIIRIFYSFARISDDIADNNNLTSLKKLKILNFFDESIRNSKKSEIDFLDKIIHLSKKFPKSKNYSRELLKAFTLDATKKRYKNWDDLVSYCKFSANPVGRFFIYLTYKINDQSLDNEKKIFESSDNLCTALQIINHIQDCKDDYLNHDRVYIPSNYFQKYSLKISVLAEKKAPIDFIFLKNELITETEKLLSHIEIGLNLIKDWRLRKETFIILNIAKRLCFLLKKEDPLLKKIKLSRIDLIICFIKGIVLN